MLYRWCGYNYKLVGWSMSRCCEDKPIFGVNSSCSWAIDDRSRINDWYGWISEFSWDINDVVTYFNYYGWWDGITRIDASMSWRF